MPFWGPYNEDYHSSFWVCIGVTLSWDTIIEEFHYLFRCYFWVQGGRRDETMMPGLTRSAMGVSVGVEGAGPGLGFRV